MKRAPVLMALIYDFDGTLAPGNMQEHSFIPAIRISKEQFWKEVRRLEEKHNADNILVYMRHMLEKARAAEIPVRKQDFAKRGRNLKFYDGVLSWFQRINRYGKESGIQIEHYIISSGIREIVMGSPIADEFTEIYASTFLYDVNGVAQWPALALNYTTKTQYLFRINKGSLKVHDHTLINKFVRRSDRRIPFEHMMYIGDGETDVPCFRLVKDQGGYSIAVHKPHVAVAKARTRKLLAEGRVSFVAPADYRDGLSLDQIVKAVIDKVAHDTYLKSLQP